MASSSPEERQSAFEQSVAILLHLWPALTLAVQNSWGGSESEDKRSWFAGIIASQFPEIPAWQLRKARKPEREEEDDEIPDTEYVETMLLQVMVDEFEVTVDDDSAFEVAENIVRSWAQCYAGNLDEANELQTRWENRRGRASGAVFKEMEDPNQDTEDDSDSQDDEDDEDEDRRRINVDTDMDMDEAPPLVDAHKEKPPPPEVDEEGFTKVVRRKR